jgi:hypothetical protein
VRAALTLLLLAAALAAVAGALTLLGRIGGGSSSAAVPADADADQPATILALHKRQEQEEEAQGQTGGGIFKWWRRRRRRGSSGNGGNNNKNQQPPPQQVDRAEMALFARNASYLTAADAKRWQREMRQLATAMAGKGAQFRDPLLRATLAAAPGGGRAARRAAGGLAASPRSALVASVVAARVARTDRHLEHVARLGGQLLEDMEQRLAGEGRFRSLERELPATVLPALGAALQARNAAARRCALSAATVVLPVEGAEEHGGRRVTCAPATRGRFEGQEEEDEEEQGLAPTAAAARRRALEPASRLRPASPGSGSPAIRSKSSGPGILGQRGGRVCDVSAFLAAKGGQGLRLALKARARAAGARAGAAAAAGGAGGARGGGVEAQQRDEEDGWGGGGSWASGIEAISWPSDDPMPLRGRDGGEEEGEEDAAAVAATADDGQRRRRRRRLQQGQDEDEEEEEPTSDADKSSTATTTPTNKSQHGQLLAAARQEEREGKAPAGRSRAAAAAAAARSTNFPPLPDARSLLLSDPETYAASRSAEAGTPPGPGFARATALLLWPSPWALLREAGGGGGPARRPWRGWAERWRRRSAGDPPPQPTTAFDEHGEPSPYAPWLLRVAAERLAPLSWLSAGAGELRAQLLLQQRSSSGEEQQAGGDGAARSSSSSSSSSSVAAAASAAADVALDLGALLPPVDSDLLSRVLAPLLRPGDVAVLSAAGAGAEAALLAASGAVGGGGDDGGGAKKSNQGGAIVALEHDRQLLQLCAANAAINGPLAIEHVVPVHGALSAAAGRLDGRLLLLLAEGEEEGRAEEGVTPGAAARKGVTPGAAGGGVDASVRAAAEALAALGGGLPPEGWAAAAAAEKEEDEGAVVSSAAALSPAAAAAVAFARAARLADRAAARYSTALDLPVLETDEEGEAAAAAAGEVQPLTDGRRRRLRQRHQRPPLAPERGAAYCSGLHHASVCAPALALDDALPVLLSASGGGLSLRLLRLGAGGAPARLALFGARQTVSRLKPVVVVDGAVAGALEAEGEEVADAGTKEEEQRRQQQQEREAAERKAAKAAAKAAAEAEQEAAKAAEADAAAEAVARAAMGLAQGTGDPLAHSEQDLGRLRRRRQQRRRRALQLPEATPVTPEDEAAAFASGLVSAAASERAARAVGARPSAVAAAHNDEDAWLPLGPRPGGGSDGGGSMVPLPDTRQGGFANRLAPDLVIATPRTRPSSSFARGGLPGYLSAAGGFGADGEGEGSGGGGGFGGEGGGDPLFGPPSADVTFERGQWPPRRRRSEGEPPRAFPEAPAAEERLLEASAHWRREAEAASPAGERLRREAVAFRWRAWLRGLGYRRAPAGHAGHDRGVEIWLPPGVELPAASGA